MLKLFRYLKRSAPIIILIVFLLVVQAMCDLALPDYTSKIVDVGISQSGIESPVFKAVSLGTMDKLFLFMPKDDKAFTASRYKLLDRDTLTETEYKSRVKEYPLLKKEPLYILNLTDTDTTERLEEILTSSAMLVAAFGSDIEEVKTLTGKIKDSFPAGTVSEDKSVFDFLALMSDDMRQQIFSEMKEKIKAVPEPMVRQLSISLVKNEYKIIGMDTDSMQSRYILLSGLKMLSIALLAAFAAVAVTFFSSRMAASLGKDLRRRVFSKVLSFSNKEMDRFSTASLITRSTNDIQQIQMMLAMLFRMVVYAPILGFGGFFKALNANSSMSWVIALALLIILTLVFVLYTIGMPRFKRIQTLVDRLNLVSREILTGLSVIRAFNNEKHEEQRFEKANKDMMKTTLFVNRLMSLMMPVMMFVMNGVAVLIVWVSAGYIDSGDMQVGSMMAFIQYTMQIVMAFLMLSAISIMMPRASVSAKRIVQVLDIDPSIKDPRQPKSFDRSKTAVLEFKDVSFRYPDAKNYALCDINFTAQPGQTTAIIGSTGSGKSTLAQLILRFFDATGGSIMFYGEDIRNVTQHNLRKHIGFVPQKAVLFSGTVASNLSLGADNVRQDELDKAADIAQASNFIKEKEGAFDADISQGGSNVSGGQKQRLSIARAIVKHPSLYVFDDSFSALDYKTDAALRAALKEVTKESTIIIVAQRISTVLGADQILVLDEGRMAGIGTHAKLMETCEVYRQIALSQLSKEELA